MVDMLVKRNIFKELKEELDQPEILILLGARQVGKTTLLEELEKFCKAQGKKTKFYDLEQPEDLRILQGDQEEIAKEISENVEYIFIDEFYYLKDAGKIFKSIYDKFKRNKKKIKIVASGSSSIEIHSHLQESLAGRMIKFQMYPFSFTEFKKVKNIDDHLKEYLKFGGLPGLIYSSNERKKRQLTDYLSSYLLKDIKSLIKEENVRAFNNLLYHLANSQGQLIEYQSLSKEVGLSNNSIKKYIEILEQTYVNFSLNSYHSNLSNELKKSKKQYFYDLGIRNSILKDFSDLEKREDKGLLLESFVFLQLKYNCKSDEEIRFWRNKDKKEVDFILLKNRIPLPIEVKSKLKEPKIPSGLKSFLYTYPKTEQAYVVNLSVSEKIDYKDCEVTFVTFDDIDTIFT